jgi:hypothetical protein
MRSAIDLGTELCWKSAINPGTEQMLALEQHWRPCELVTYAKAIAALR